MRLAWQWQILRWRQQRPLGEGLFLLDLPRLLGLATWILMLRELFEMRGGFSEMIVGWQLMLPWVTCTAWQEMSVGSCETRGRREGTPTSAWRTPMLIGLRPCWTGTGTQGAWEEPGTGSEARVVGCAALAARSPSRVLPLGELTASGSW